MQVFKDYNIYDKSIINVGDAVKITTSPQYESFWVEVERIDNLLITGSVQNNLVREHDFNLNDVITFSVSNVKEYKKKEDRFKIDNLDEEYRFKLYLSNILNMSIDEFDKTLNIQYVEKD